jgi:polysaccharide chain length determinant protein (PEP-CTERM system associated)
VEQEHEKPQRSLEEYWAVLRHRRWYLILPLIIGWVALLGSTWLIPTRYRSDTVILVEQQQVPEQYVVPNVTADLQTRMKSMSEQILSRTRLLAIADKLNLYVGDRGRMDQEALVARMRDDITINLVTTNSRRQELTAFKISYSGSSAAVAQQVTTELGSLFIDENLRSRAQASENTTSFFESQLSEARKDLDEQESRLRDFKAKYLGELPEQLQSNVQILSGLQSRVQSATDTLNRAEQQRLYLESLSSQYKDARAQITASGDVATTTPPALDQQLEKLKAQLNELSAKYLPKNPEIIRLKGQIAAAEQLKSKIEEDLKAAPKSGETGAATQPVPVTDLRSSTPVMQIESQLKATQLEIANDKTQIKQINAQIELYQSRLNLTPVREQQLAAIVRDHEQSRANYDSLLAKKMQSELATNLEKRQQGEQFRVIDAPSLPEKPYWPNRFYFSLIGVAVGLMVGGGLVVLLEIADTRIYGEHALKTIISSPIMVSVPGLWTKAEEHRQRRAVWLQAIGGGMMLIIITAVTVLAYIRG